MISYGVCRANEGTIMMRPIDHIAFSVFKLAITTVLVVRPNCAGIRCHTKEYECTT